MSDVQLVVAADGAHAPRMLGMGAVGRAAAPIEWTWELKEGVGNNRLWLGDVDAVKNLIII